MKGLMQKGQNRLKERWRGPRKKTTKTIKSRMCAEGKREIEKRVRKEKRKERKREKREGRGEGERRERGTE